MREENGIGFPNVGVDCTIMPMPFSRKGVATSTSIWPRLKSTMRPSSWRSCEAREAGKQAGR
jgi:hypothetical protein